jgi:hypothetical protein
MRFVRPLAIFVLITVVLVPLSWLPAPWAAGHPAAWRPATCLPDACFCEAIGTGFIRQPIDTWSNLAFVLVGLLILEDVLRPSSARSNLLAQRRVYGIIYAVAALLVGFGSWFYHASLTFVGQWFDVMGMYLLGTFMVLYTIARLRPLSGRVFTLSYVLFNIVLGVSLIVVPELRRYLFGILLIVTIVLEVILRRRRNRVSSTRQESLTTRRNAVSADLRYFGAALLIYILAQIIWTLDLNHIVCDPYGILQGHAVWHLLTALSAGLLYLYYRSERGTLSGGAQIA